MTILDGKALAAKIKIRLKEEAETLDRAPCLAAVLVGEDPASKIYVANKRKDCEECGFLSREYNLDTSVTQEELLQLIAKLNTDDTIDGILVQLPLPAHIDENIVIEAIDPMKDVDAFHPVNVGRMVASEPNVWPCTPKGIITLLEEYRIDAEGKTCVVIGRSNIVGKPVGLLMLKKHATVVFCHTATKDLAAMTRQADILITAAGCRGLVRADMVKDGVVVVDVAMNRDPETGKFTGDVLFDEVSQKASYITPVPGGVGPMTRAILIQNLLELAKMHNR